MARENSTMGKAKESRSKPQGGTLIREPTAQDWEWLHKVAGPVDEDFIQAATEQPEVHGRRKPDCPK